MGQAWTDNNDLFPDLMVGDEVDPDVELDLDSFEEEAD